MKAVSFNVNSVRMRLHQLEKLIETERPDFIGLQETKVRDEEFPEEAIKSMGYFVEYHGQKTHYGVALLSKHPFKAVQKGFKSDTEDSQKRFISGTFEMPCGEELTIMNGYFPQGEGRKHPTKFPAKEKYYQDLQSLIEGNYQPTDKLIVMGDMNISHQDIDIGIGEDNRKRWLRTEKCSFLPEEREWLNRLLDWGLIDPYRKKFPNGCDNAYSWFDYRSKGFDREPRRGLRIDMVLATQPLLEKGFSAGINYEVRAMDKPSDHAPIWTSFDLNP